MRIIGGIFILFVVWSFFNLIFGGESAAYVIGGILVLLMIIGWLENH
jgi:hypothetical protein